jgi:hypothetical protein
MTEVSGLNASGIAWSSQASLVDASTKDHQTVPVIGVSLARGQLRTVSPLIAVRRRDNSTSPNRQITGGRTRHVHVSEIRIV